MGPDELVPAAIVVVVVVGVVVASEIIWTVGAGAGVATVVAGMTVVVVTGTSSVTVVSVTGALTVVVVVVTTDVGVEGWTEAVALVLLIGCGVVPDEIGACVPLADEPELEEISVADDAAGWPLAVLV